MAAAIGRLKSAGSQGAMGSLDGEAYAGENGGGYEALYEQPGVWAWRLKFSNSIFGLKNSLENKALPLQWKQGAPFGFPGWTIYRAEK